MTQVVDNFLVTTQALPSRSCPPVNNLPPNHFPRLYQQLLFLSLFKESSHFPALPLVNPEQHALQAAAVFVEEGRPLPCLLGSAEPGMLRGASPQRRLQLFFEVKGGLPRRRMQGGDGLEQVADAWVGSGCFPPRLHCLTARATRRTSAEGTRGWGKERGARHRESRLERGACSARNECGRARCARGRGGQAKALGAPCANAGSEIPSAVSVLQQKGSAREKKGGLCVSCRTPPPLRLRARKPHSPEKIKKGGGGGGRADARARENQHNKTLSPSCSQEGVVWILSHTERSEAQ